MSEKKYNNDSIRQLVQEYANNPNNSTLIKAIEEADVKNYN